MDMLTLNLNKDALLDLMKNFYLLTNIKIALFDLDGYEILSYPKEHCAFCAKIRSTKKAMLIASKVTGILLHDANKHRL